MLRASFYITITLLSLSLLSGCQFTAQQQQEFNPEKAALARLKLCLGYLAQAKNPTDRTDEDIKLAYYNLMLANKYSPNNPNVMLGMALFDQQVGEDNEAEMIYKTITKIAPTNGLYAIHYGSFLCVRSQYDLAVKQFQSAISLKGVKWKADALEQLGYCAIQHGDIKQADEAFTALFNYDATRRQQVANQALLYQKNGDNIIANYLFVISK